MQAAYAKLGIDVNQAGGGGGGDYYAGNPWGNWGVPCYQARVVSCYIENLPDGSQPNNSKTWPKCLRSTSGNTYMFVRSIRDAIHGKVRHAYLLRETAPGSGRYNFDQSEQRAVKEMKLVRLLAARRYDRLLTLLTVCRRPSIAGTIRKTRGQKYKCSIVLGREVAAILCVVCTSARSTTSMCTRSSRTAMVASSSRR